MILPPLAHLIDHVPSLALRNNLEWLPECLLGIQGCVTRSLECMPDASAAVRSHPVQGVMVRGDWWRVTYTRHLLLQLQRRLWIRGRSRAPVTQCMTTTMHDVITLLSPAICARRQPAQQCLQNASQTERIILDSSLRHRTTRRKLWRREGRAPLRDRLALCALGPLKSSVQS